MNNITVFDGAYGTYLLSETQLQNPCEMANIEAPETVTRIHREYIASGANAIKTNTFSIDPHMREKLIRAGFDLAAQATKNTDVKIFADIGPIYSENAPEEYLQTAEIFMDRGAQNFLFETLSEIKNAQRALAHIKSSLPTAVVIASFAVGYDGYTRTGEHYQALLDEATAYGANYVGLNCVCGPVHMLELLKKLPQSKYNLIAMPNAGYPTVVNGRTIYMDNPDYYAEKLFEISALDGVKIVGGCCGTTPLHIKKLTQKLEKFKEAEKWQNNAAAIQTLIRSGRSGAKKSFNKAVAIAVEISPPMDTDTTYIVEAAKLAKQSGADFITIPDSPLGRVRVSSMMMSALIKREAGISVIPHISCRDRNQIALKGDLLGANIEGINFCLAVTGDPVAEIHRDDIKNVFSFNSFKLIRFIKNLNETVFAARPFHICAAMNTGAANFSVELDRANKKIEAGAEFFFTQPLFSRQNIENFLLAQEKLKGCGCKVFAGIMPPASYKNALFLNNEVPGIEIPQEIISELKDRDEPQSKEIILNYTKDIILQIGEKADGYYLMTPLKKIDYTTELIKFIKNSTGYTP